MQVLWRTNRDGTTYTTCLYRLHGRDTSANLPGHLTPEFAQDLLETLRRNTTPHSTT